MFYQVVLKAIYFYDCLPSIRIGINVNTIRINFCRDPRQFLKEVSMSPDMFWWDVLALSLFVVVLRIAAFLLLKWKLNAVR
jgi:hypothetical protein